MEEAPDTNAMRRTDRVFDGLPVHLVEGLLPFLVDDADQMNQGLSAREGGIQGGRIQHVAGRGRDRSVIAIPGSARIARQDSNLMPSAQEGVHHMGADESCAAGDENFQAGGRSTR